MQWILIEDFENPNTNMPVKRCVISHRTPQILIVPKGCVNGFQALEIDSSLMVFSSATLDESKEDDYRWEMDYFQNAEWKKE